ncbi:hypothetical protein MXL46_09300 [Heyndrickxia sporothermodurans]|uniref:DsDNA-specific endonuclease/ATPase MutS2 n=1 Tax=Siminovitchia thermophila TaxID=1245522 RepID=A0ABS2R8M9_9BACI|nr:MULTISPECIES: hypothetical protein [Bacillaceae]MBM7716002.1 dsDNA-specific endonuclease/ATPase MutS2 [Siminovitchia thermophila]MEB6549289.1 hypothetical protein [Heyndrickxia sporothermodurans]
MTANWKKRYSFRLTDGDEDLGQMLENVPDSKKSEMIRNMLKYAYRMMNEERKEKKELDELKKALLDFKESYQLQHEELLKELRKGIKVAPGQYAREEVEQEDAVSEDAIRNSAQAFLTSFGGVE